MRHISIFAVSLAVAGTPAMAQQPAALGALKWRSVGPANNAGRISVVAGVPGNRDIYYVAGANGGIIKTTNGGVTFKPIFDKQSVASIGAIAVAMPVTAKLSRRFMSSWATILPMSSSTGSTPWTPRTAPTSTGSTS